jgi:16S rRNA (guanine527-N7)-methyltransferase
MTADAGHAGAFAPEVAAALDAGLAALELPVGAAAAATPQESRLPALLLKYLALLNEWNAIHNLTAIREPRDQVTKHLLDSLAILPWIPEQGRLLDVGTGAGLPGIPLALARPALEVTLLDARHKKVQFCQLAAATLGLAVGDAPRVRAVHARCEQFHGPRFDAIVSRAFSSLAEFVALTAQLGDAETRWLAMKGSRPDAEIAALASHPKAKAFRVEAVHPLKVPGLEAERCLVVLRRG